MKKLGSLTNILYLGVCMYYVYVVYTLFIVGDNPILSLVKQRKIEFIG